MVTTLRVMTETGPRGVGLDDVAEPPVEVDYYWTDSNRPWKYDPGTTPWLDKMEEFYADKPRPTIVPLFTSQPTFEQNYSMTIGSVPGSGRVQIQLPADPFGLPKIFEMNGFKLAGSSGKATFAFGLPYSARFAGFLGHGADKSRIRMKGNSVSAAQLAEMATMTRASFAPLLMGVAYLNSPAGGNFFMGGVGWESEDQNLLTQVAADLTTTSASFPIPVYVPQPAPHQGIVFQGSGPIMLSHCAFIGVGRAMLSQPPFEMANISTQYTDFTAYNCESDGRRHKDIDPAQPRRCTVIMGNNETRHKLDGFWGHHSNQSRYAVNDQNRDTFGEYTIRRFRFNNISEERNIDPAINGGQPLGGSSPVTPIGFEDFAGVAILEDGFIEQAIGYTQNGQKPAHWQTTKVGSRVFPAGSLTVRRVKTTHTGYPAYNDFWTVRIGNNTPWRVGPNNYPTIKIYHPDTDVLLTPVEVLGTWGVVPSGANPATNYLAALA